ncbi:hypothetical protein C8A05DRAFT_29912 [Staphylotrichum tortipilum]|uniref:Uncharacterized protein n=1 Tax=Staphylotrichum tortipilum TaxID=2831512 RepID=A0AAN6RXW4_9PEZI|nr:hypothetical protein C8A05DRAFT_29912 [Staphylotrichum longicolle]
MTGKQLSDDHRAILAKLFQIPKLTDQDIAFILDIDQRTAHRRRIEFAETGALRKHRDVSKNAEKLKPQHLEKLVEWHKTQPDALLGDMQEFLRTQCGLEISLPTISRQIRKSYGGMFLRDGVSARRRLKKQRQAEGRSLVTGMQQQQQPGHGIGNRIANKSGNGHGGSNDESKGEMKGDGANSRGDNSNLHSSASNYVADRVPGPMPYHDQRQLAPPDLLLLQGLQEPQ